MSKGINSAIFKKTGVAIFFLFLQRIYGFDMAITGAEIGIGVVPEYNRSFYYSWDIMAFSSIEFNRDFVLSEGVSMGQIWDTFDINANIAAEYGLPFFRPYAPIFLKTAYIYNGLPEYKTHTHTLLPTFSLQWRYFGFSAGPTLRFTSFDNESAIFEPIIAYSVYVNFYNTDSAQIGIGLSDFSDFSAENSGSYSFNLNNRFRISRMISIENKLELAMSGNVRQIVSVYGITYKGGLIFTW